MFVKLLTYAVRALVRGPGKSWVFTSGAMSLLKLVRKTKGRREVIDLSTSKPGDKFVIEHLDVTHKAQLRGEKVAKKTAKADKKAIKKAIKAAK